MPGPPHRAHELVEYPELSRLPPSRLISIRFHATLSRRRHGGITSLSSLPAGGTRPQCTEGVSNRPSSTTVSRRLVRKLPQRLSVRTPSRSSPPPWRRLPVGAELAPNGGVHFRVWAPRIARVDVALGDEAGPLAAEPHGYHSGRVPRGRSRDAVRVSPRRRPDLSRSGVALPARRPARPVGGDRSRRLLLDR